MELFLKTKKSAVVSLIWLLIYLSIIPMQLSAYVLCIGANGHVAFEAAVNGRCTDTHTFDSKYTETTIAMSASEEDHCGSCIDLAVFVPLNTRLYLVPAKNTSINTTVPVSTLMTYQQRVSTIPTRASVQDFPSLINATLTSLRSTILVI